MSSRKEVLEYLADVSGDALLRAHDIRTLDSLSDKMLVSVINTLNDIHSLTNGSLRLTKFYRLELVEEDDVPF